MRRRIRHRIARWSEKIQIAVAWRCPRWLVKWCAVRLGCNATQGKWSSQVVPELSFMDALKRWY
jgi:hypothetical protein